MKILVFSDSHGRYANIQRAISLHPDADMLIHLGDGVKDLENISHSIPIVKTVNGNFEDGLFGRKKGRTTVSAAGKRIFMCHGHTERVGFGLQGLIYSALEEGADIALYGHTHVKHNEYIPSALSDSSPFGLYVFNPGSITLPRDSIRASFGIIEIKNNGILLSHGSI